MYVKAVDEGGPLAEVGRDCKPCHYYVDSTYKAYLYNDNEVEYAKYDQRSKRRGHCSSLLMTAFDMMAGSKNASFASDSKILQSCSENKTHPIFTIDEQ
jgi:hypothetical protein